jgi:hypothetical protein
MIDGPTNGVRSEPLALQLYQPTRHPRLRHFRLTPWDQHTRSSVLAGPVDSAPPVAGPGARGGFGGCRQAVSGACRGFYGPGSDRRTQSAASCRLTVAEGRRRPRRYWELGARYFRPTVFTCQGPGEVCPLRDTYQLMRNFLFAAELGGGRPFAVLAVAPARHRARLEHEVERFRRTVLAPQWGARVGLVAYERYLEILTASGEAGARELAAHLSSRLPH